MDGYGDQPAAGWKRSRHPGHENLNTARQYVEPGESDLGRGGSSAGPATTIDSSCRHSPARGLSTARAQSTAPFPG